MKSLRNRICEDTSTKSVERKPVEDSKETSAISARCKSLLAILYLWAFSPFLLFLALLAWVSNTTSEKKFAKVSPGKKLRILVTGGKMTKASAVARAVGRYGHKVFTAEISPYQFCHTRFCTYVSKHFVLPRPTVHPNEWLETMKTIVTEENIDLIIPCTAPVESTCYAHLREKLPSNVRIFAFDGETSDKLDNKYTFNKALVKAGLPCPETALMECLEDAVDFFRDKHMSQDDGKRYIVKPAVYDPKARSEIMFLPIADQNLQLEYLKSRNATKEVPYVIQEVLENPEYGSYSIYNNGKLTGFEVFKSCASCLVYQQSQGHQYEKVKELHTRLGQSLNLTGQLTLDLMHTPSGELVPIECNPRIHSAIVTLEDHKHLGAVLTDPKYNPMQNSEIVTSQPETSKYWVMDQLFLRAGFWKSKDCFSLTFLQMLKGDDAILSGDDPLPFLAMYLIQIPSLLVLEFLSGKQWHKIDFCIGKIVKEGGD